MKKIKNILIPLLMMGLFSLSGCGTASTPQSIQSDADTPQSSQSDSEAPQNDELDSEAPQITMSSHDKPNIAICWNNVQTSYSYESTFAAVGELDANIVKLDMVRSYDLQYDAD